MMVRALVTLGFFIVAVPLWASKEDANDLISDARKYNYATLRPDAQIYMATYLSVFVGCPPLSCEEIVPKELYFLDFPEEHMTMRVAHPAHPIVIATPQGLRKNKDVLEDLLLQEPDLELVLNLGRTQWHEWVEETCRQMQRVTNETKRFCTLFQGVDTNEVISRDLPPTIEEKPGKVFTFEEGDFPGALRKLYLTNASGKQFFYRFQFDKARFESLKLHPLVKEYGPESEGP